MSSNAAPQGASIETDSVQARTPVEKSEKGLGSPNHLELVQTTTKPGNRVYDDNDVKPELHMRTYLALLALFLLNFVQTVCLQGPSSVLSYIGEDLNGPSREAWIPNALSLVQAVIGPLIASASDTSQARKLLLVGPCVISFIGSAIAPGSISVNRLIACQILIDFGFANVPLAYCVPS